MSYTLYTLSKALTLLLNSFKSISTPSKVITSEILELQLQVLYFNIIHILFLHIKMKAKKIAFALLLLVVLVSGQNKGMTWKASAWPSASNAWIGKMSCVGCDAYNGDTLCSTQLPILCINYYKTLARIPYPVSSGGVIPDKGFYNGWSGGVFSVTSPVKGSFITSQAIGTKYCQSEFGSTSMMAEHHQGRYMSNMNSPLKIWNTWNWSQTSEGGWGMWGYFAHNYSGPTWVWINNQPNGNCN